MDFDLKTLDSTTKFEGLCKHILLKPIPSLKSIDGRGGDGGVDAFVGEFNGELTVFQSKYFTDRVGSSQRKQIADSLEIAKTENPGMKAWILMIATDFNTDETRWFESEIKQKNEHLKIDYWDRTKLLSEVAKYEDIQETFFNKSIIVAARMAEKAVPFLAGGPISKVYKIGDYLQEMKQQYPHLGLGYSISSKDKKTEIHVNPPHQPIEFRLRTKIKADKFGGFKDFKEVLNELNRTGETLTLSEDEILGFEFISEGLGELIPEGSKFNELKIYPSYKDRKVPAIFEVSNTDICFDNVELAPVKIDGEKVSLKVANAPYDITLMLDIKNKDGKINFNYEIKGKTVSEIFRFDNFVKALLDGNKILIRDKNTKNLMMSIIPNLSPESELDSFWVDIVRSLYHLEQLTGITFTLPERVTIDEYDDLKFVLELLTEKKAGRSIKNASMSIDRAAAVRLVESFEKENEIKNLIVGLKQVSFSLFGNSILIGEVKQLLPPMKIDNLTEVKNDIEKNLEYVKFVLSPVEANANMEVIQVN